MPVPMRTTNLKAEAKYNVTTEFPSLGLHSAAATGNVGLVEYALSRGQPINSVLDGVLPLHAACSGGNVLVVRKLIEHGADVNAPRLPRRYSNDKNRDASAPIVGTSGSTPLHFAAANGNTKVVSTLLLHGAHANRSDKHGVTPEMLARQNGWLECADLLKDWVANKDKDLRERESRITPGEDTNQSVYTSKEVSGPFGTSDGEVSTRKRIRMKHSLDHALNLLKPSSSTLADAYARPLNPSSTAATSTPPSSNGTREREPPSPVSKPFGEYTFYPLSPEANSDEQAIESERRPSLPQIYLNTTRNRKTSGTVSSPSPSPRRPRSAGTGAEPSSPRTPSSPPNIPRKLGSKYSLMNLFKKGQITEESEMPRPHNSSLSIATSSTLNLPLSGSPQPPSPLGTSSFSLPHTNDSVPSSSPASRSGFRFLVGNEPSPRSNDIPIPYSQPQYTTAVDLHNSLSLQHTRDQPEISDNARHDQDDPSVAPEHHRQRRPSSPHPRLGILRTGNTRDRSGSRSSNSGGHSQNRSGTVFDDDMVVPGIERDVSGKLIRPPGPGILRGHNRSSSSGLGGSSSTSGNTSLNSSGTGSGFRALRFDSNSSAAGRRKEDGGVGVMNLRGSNSTGSLGKLNEEADRSKDHQAGNEHIVPESAPPNIGDFEISKPAGNNTLTEEEDDEEYGQPITRSTLNSVILEAEIKSPLTALRTRERGQSFASSESSLSPVVGNGDIEVVTSQVGDDFPFSINRPPPTPSDDHLSVPVSMDNRERGDSMSSTMSMDSTNPPLSFSGTTNTSGSGSVTAATPGTSPSSLPSSPRRKGRELFEGENDDTVDDRFTYLIHESRLHARSHNPLDLNIRSISSHTQAEELVHRAEQSILEMKLVDEPQLLGTAGLSPGWTPLTAKLAALGESLALQRQLRDKQGQEEGDVIHKAILGDGGGDFSASSPSAVFARESSPGIQGAQRPRRRDGLDRQFSLEQRSSPGSLSRMKEPKRPNTSSGTPSPGMMGPDRHFSDEIRRQHQPSLSTSAVQPSYDSSFMELESPIVPLPSPGPVSYTTTEPSAPYHAAVRPRTPDAVRDLNSSDGDGIEDLSLCRVSTAPSSTSLPRSKRDQARNIASASKLTRMGFAPPAVDAAPRSVSSTSKRFGGLKSLMQTFKGKS